jgi:hypothetical protein
MSRRDKRGRETRDAQRDRDANDEQQGTGPRLWGSTASKAITSAGAIAGAIVAIVGVGKLVIPDKQPSNPHDSVSIRAVQAIPQSLSDFRPALRREREADGGSITGTIVLAANALKLLAEVTHDRPAERANAQVLAPKVPVVLPEATTSADFVATAATIVDTAQPLVPDVNLESCDLKMGGVCMAILFMLGAISVDREGRAVAPEVAAKRIATVLSRTRTVKAGGRRVPLGLLVTTKIRLVGLNHRDVSLMWSVLPIDGQGALGPVWRGPNLSYRLSAEDEDDRVVVPLWIPLPKRKGRYIVRLDAFRGNADLEQADSKPFRSP